MLTLFQLVGFASLACSAFFQSLSSLHNYSLCRAGFRSTLRCDRSSWFSGAENNRSLFSRFWKPAVPIQGQRGRTPHGLLQQAAQLLASGSTAHLCLHCHMASLSLCLCPCLHVAFSSLCVSCFLFL